MLVGQGSTMAAMRNTTAQPLETATLVTLNPNNQEINPTDSSTSYVSSDYEKCREQRIKENLERMKKLGINDLAFKLKPPKPNNKPLATNQNKTPLASSVPTRRSSRLQNIPAVIPPEAVLSKKGKDGNEKTEVKKKRGTCTLSPQLQKLTGASELPMTEISKQVWMYIKKHDLQDPANGRFIRCDGPLRELFGVDVIEMFQMTKALGKHIWPLGSDSAPVSSEPKEKQQKKKKARRFV